MNKLQEFILSKPMGFLEEKDMPELIKLDRLCPVLVRCGGCRFTCGAQYLEHLIKCIVAGGDYVRDVSFPVGAVERAANWVSECPSQNLAHGSVPKTYPLMPGLGEIQKNAAGLSSVVHKKMKGESVQFDESQCGGVFDGFGVVSDADPGL